MCRRVVLNDWAAKTPTNAVSSHSHLNQADLFPEDLKFGELSCKDLKFGELPRKIGRKVQRSMNLASHDFTLKLIISTHAFA